MTLLRSALLALSLPLTCGVALAQQTGTPTDGPRTEVRAGADGIPLGTIADRGGRDTRTQPVVPRQRTRGLVARKAPEPRGFVIPWQTGIYQ